MNLTNYVTHLNFALWGFIKEAGRWFLVIAISGASLALAISIATMGTVVDWIFEDKDFK